jgi:hypothetical protein
MFQRHVTMADHRAEAFCGRGLLILESLKEDFRSAIGFRFESGEVETLQAVENQLLPGFLHPCPSSFQTRNSRASSPEPRANCLGADVIWWSHFSTTTMREGASIQARIEFACVSPTDLDQPEKASEIRNTPVLTPCLPDPAR